jgi:hypothetical protein
LIWAAEPRPLEVPKYAKNLLMQLSVPAEPELCWRLNPKVLDWKVWPPILAVKTSALIVIGSTPRLAATCSVLRYLGLWSVASEHAWASSKEQWRGACHCIHFQGHQQRLIESSAPATVAIL